MLRKKNKKNRKSTILSLLHTTKTSPMFSLKLYITPCKLGLLCQPEQLQCLNFPSQTDLNQRKCNGHMNFKEKKDKHIKDNVSHSNIAEQWRVVAVVGGGDWGVGSATS